MKKGRKLSAEFKAKVALDALTGDLTLTELSSKYNVHVYMITKWKKPVQEGTVETFSERKQDRRVDHESEIKDLHAKIGQLIIENDFL